MIRDGPEKDQIKLVRPTKAILMTAVINSGKDFHSRDKGDRFNLICKYTSSIILISP